MNGSQLSDDVILPTSDDDGNPIWELENYTDWQGGTHILEGGYPQDWAEVDIAVISWTDSADGSVQYATLVGPWDDWDDFQEIVADYFENGTP